MSWTSSLLFALQYGLYRHHSKEDGSELGDIFLFVLDTQQFPKGTFVKDMEIVKVFAKFSENSQRDNLDNLFQMRKKEYFFGEYLSQGDLNVAERCAETTIRKVIDLGLFLLYPELGVESQWGQWAKAVVNLRQPFKDLENLSLAPHTAIRKAISIAETCFEGHWALPMAAMLLALRPRQEHDAVITHGLAAMFSGK